MRNRAEGFGEVSQTHEPAFLDEMYKVAVQFIDRTPRVDPRAVATVLDNSIVDKLAKEGFIEKAFSKGAR
jgi:hypothetical protein